MDEAWRLLFVIGAWFLVSILVSPMIGLLIHGRREGQHASPLDAPRVRHHQE